MLTEVNKLGMIILPDNQHADDNQIFPYRGRVINIAIPLQVYRNLHKKCYSVRQSGLVVAHANKLCLKDCRFVVNEKGRDKVRETKKKFVHAWIEGFYTPSGCGTTAKGDLRTEIKYNPLREDYFTCYNLVKDPLHVKSAKFVILSENKITASYIN